MKKHNWQTCALWILFAEAAGGLSGWLARDGMAVYRTELLKPPLSPPGVVFPIVWTILFALMGIGAARISLSPASPARTRGLGLFLVQLAFNFSWSLIFFNLRRFGFALLWLTALWLLILWMTLSYRRVDRLAAGLQIPYLLWVAFAGYLNLGVWMLN